MEKLLSKLVFFTVNSIEAFNGDKKESNGFYSLTKLIAMDSDQKISLYSALNVENVLNITCYWHEYLTNNAVSSFSDLLSKTLNKKTYEKILKFYNNNPPPRDRDTEEIGEAFTILKLVEEEYSNIIMHLFMH